VGTGIYGLTEEIRDSSWRVHPPGELGSSRRLDDPLREPEHADQAHSPGM